MKVTKEEIVGMLRAVEAWRTDHDLQADFEKWKSWHAHIAERITRVPGVQAEAQGPIRGGPFPTLKISWEPERIASDCRRSRPPVAEWRTSDHEPGRGRDALVPAAAGRNEGGRV